MMMKRVCLLVLLTLLVYPIYAQSLFDLVETRGGKIIAVPRPKEFNFSLFIPEASYQSYTPFSTLEMDAKLRQFVPEYQSTSVAERPMDMQVLSAAYRPFFNVYAPMLMRVSPMAFDFRETSIVPLNTNTAFFATGTQYTWPGMGGMTTINSGLVWQQGAFTVAGGGFAGRYFTPFNISPGFMTGTNMQVSYDVNERITLRGWGQYTYYEGQEKYNPHMLMNPNYNHTNVGGAFEFYFNDNFGVGMGVNYEYNPWKRKMERQVLLFPVFR